MMNSKILILNEIKSKMNTPIIVDTRRIFDSNRAEEIDMMYYGVGYGVNINENI